MVPPQDQLCIVKSETKAHEGGTEHSQAFAFASEIDDQQLAQCTRLINEGSDLLQVCVQVVRVDILR